MTSVFHHSFLVPFASDLSVLLATKTPVLVVRRTKLPFPPTSSQKLRSPKPFSSSVVRVRRCPSPSPIRSVFLLPSSSFSCLPRRTIRSRVLRYASELSVRVRAHPKPSEASEAHPKFLSIDLTLGLTFLTLSSLGCRTDLSCRRRTLALS